MMRTSRHPGLDPGSTFSLALHWKEGGCRIKSGMTGFVE
jgi:hypothetical protein